MCRDDLQKQSKTYGSPLIQRLVNLCLDGSQCRRVIANLVFYYKVMYGLHDINLTKFITLSSSAHLCGNQFQLVKPRFVSVRDALF
jgi:hypothetical protein